MHVIDNVGYPVNPELRQLEFQLGELAAAWRGAADDPVRAATLVEQYHVVFAELVAQGWVTALDYESELPYPLMPPLYLEWDAMGFGTTQPT